MATGPANIRKINEQVQDNSREIKWLWAFVILSSMHDFWEAYGDNISSFALTYWR